MKIAETNHLYLRKLTEQDAENLYLLNLDPDVIKYTGDLPFESIEKARTFLLNYHHYAKYGYGRWAVIRKQDEAFLGWCGLKYSPESDDTDIGFRFFKKYWNMGYATESARACIELGFQKFGLRKMVGHAMKDNVGSIKVLEKIGMQYWKPFEFDGKEGVFFRIEKEKRK